MAKWQRTKAPWSGGSHMSGVMVTLHGTHNIATDNTHWEWLDATHKGSHRVFQINPLVQLCRTSRTHYSIHWPTPMGKPLWIWRRTSRWRVSPTASLYRPLAQPGSMSTSTPRLLSLTGAWPSHIGTRTPPGFAETPNVTIGISGIA